MTTVLLIIIYIAFISLGLPDSMLGAAWPTIRADLSLPVAGAGLISMITSGGTIVSSMLSGKFLQKLGTGKVTLFSVSLTALALLGFSFRGNYVWLCIMAVPLGLGAGAVDAALNNFVALHFSARHMSWLHSFWGVGATLGPVIMAVAISQSGVWQRGYRTVAMIQIGLVIILLLALPLWKAYREGGPESGGGDQNGAPLFRLPGIIPALLGFFSYCALETTAGLWGASYLVQTKGMAANVAAGWVSTYYLGITIGRFLNGFLTAKFRNVSLIRAGQGAIGAGALALLLFPQPVVYLLGLILIGVGCAPIYPSMLHETPVRFGKENSSRLMGIQMAFAYMGTTLVPPALGLVMGSFGVQLYPLFLLGLLVVMGLSSERTIQSVAARGGES